jgi:putative membrane protein
MWERLPWEGIADAVTQIDVLAGLAITLGAIAWVISIVATVLTYGNFEIRRLGDQLQVRHGLLDRRQTTIPVRRIQAVRVVEGLLRQPFGYAEVRFDSAGFGADEGASGVLCPLLPRTAIPAFLDVACPDFAQELNPAGMQRLPRRAMRRYVMAACIGWVLLVVVAAAVAWRFTEIPAELVLLALVVTPIFGWLGYRRYLDAGWLVEDGHLFLRWRAVARVTVFTQVRRLQYRELTVDPFQRRASLATFRTAVASGGSREGFSLPHLDRGEAEVLLDQLGRRSGRPVVGRGARRLLPVGGDGGRA